MGPITVRREQYRDGRGLTMCSGRAKMGIDNNHEHRKSDRFSILDSKPHTLPPDVIAGHVPPYKAMPWI